MRLARDCPSDLTARRKEEVKNEEKGGGKGSWSAWKAGEMAKRYEERVRARTVAS